MFNNLNSRSSELACSLSTPITAQLIPQVDYHDQQFIQEYDIYSLGKSLFDCKEFERAAFFLENCKSSKGFFLHMYAKFLVGQIMCFMYIFYYHGHHYHLYHDNHGYHLHHYYFHCHHFKYHHFHK